MTLPDIASLIPKWKTYAAIAGIALAIATGLYFKGHSDGYNEADDQWKAAFAVATFKEVKRDTVYIPAKPESGHFASTPATADAAYQARVDRIVDTSAVAIGRYITVNDSLRQSNLQLKSRLQLAFAPRLIHLQTPAIGDLILRYFPADDSANVYQYTPAPRQVVTVYTEKLVLEPRSDLETAAYIALGTGVGILVAVIAHIK